MKVLEMERPFAVQAALNELRDRDGHRELPPELDKTQDYHITQGFECFRSFGLVDFWTFMTERHVEKQAVIVWKMLQDWQSCRFLWGY